MYLLFRRYVVISDSTPLTYTALRLTNPRGFTRGSELKVGLSRVVEKARKEGREDGQKLLRRLRLE